MSSEIAPTSIELAVVEQLEDWTGTLCAALRTYYTTQGGLPKLAALQTAVEAATQVVALMEHVRPMLDDEVSLAVRSRNPQARHLGRQLRNRLNLVHGARLYGDVQRILDVFTGGD